MKNQTQTNQDKSWKKSKTFAVAATCRRETEDTFRYSPTPYFEDQPETLMLKALTGEYMQPFLVLLDPQTTIKSKRRQTCQTKPRRISCGNKEFLLSYCSQPIVQLFYCSSILFACSLRQSNQVLENWLGQGS